jgi:arylsulfatase A-like enzyme
MMKLKTWGSPILMAAAMVVPLTTAGLAREARAAEKPNILFIMVDDLGKEWISCYGAEGIRTPWIDALASRGMRFENAYSMPQCTPTRVTLLTGQYPFRHGWTNHFDVPRWGSGGHFDPEQNASFARVLKRAGYATCAAGKWQIDDFRVEPKAMQEAGFDEWCMWTGFEAGNPPSANRYWDPYINTRDGSRTYKDQFGPDVYCNFLIDFMQRHRDEPMLLYYPMCLTHGPLVTTPDEPNAKSNPDKHKAMVRYTDKLVGRLIEALDKIGLREKTIVIFTTDNGSGGGQTGIRLGHKVRGAKAKMVEAGTAMPFIVNCPGLVPEGVVTDALTDFTDILPTFAELAGARPSDKFPVDGKSIAPLILGKAEDSPRDWILSVGGGAATFRDNRVSPKQEYDDRVIRDKRWKLWVGTDRRAQKLFDLENDPWETNNLLDRNRPDAVSAWKRLMGVVQQHPQSDARPHYTPNPAQPWDKFEYQPPE